MIETYNVLMYGDVRCLCCKPNLQDEQKLPKWNQRSRLGQFLGFSDEHSPLVENFRNLTTGYILPQYHVVFDDLFETAIREG